MGIMKLGFSEYKILQYTVKSAYNDLGCRSKAEVANEGCYQQQQSAQATRVKSGFEAEA